MYTISLLAFLFSFTVNNRYDHNTQSNNTSINNIPAYKDPSLPIHQRVADLLSRMTLDEKIAQIQCLYEGKRHLSDDNNKFSEEKAAKLIPHGIGQIGRPFENVVLNEVGLGDYSKYQNKTPRETAEYTNAVQKFLREKTRLGIPVIFHDEALHGLVAYNATSYPQAIALSCSWDTKLLEELYSAVAEEVRSRGSHQTLSPVLDIARDARFGRIDETLGEDPFLTSRLGEAIVRGLQGREGPKIPENKVAATLKHFCAYGQPEAGSNVGPANYSEKYLRENLFYPFEYVVKNAKVKALMASYNEINGIPSHANDWLMNKVLRKEWGFGGLVVSDYMGVTELMTLHRVAESKEMAIKKSLEAGVDTEFGDIDCSKYLKQLILDSKIKMSVLDSAVARHLKLKFELGLFENPYVDPEKAEKLAENSRYKELALKAAYESVVLLKNEGNMLPLSKTAYKRIAVIGPNANKVRLGSYSGKPLSTISLVEGIREKLKGVEVLTHEGCKITKSENWYEKESKMLESLEVNMKLIKEAVAVAKRADLVILNLGGTELTAGESAPGDRLNLDLPGNQNELVEEILKTQKPVVVVLTNGQPLSLNKINDKVPAILESWYLGQMTGKAIADVLFGDVCPSGKLTMTFPRSAAQCPIYYSYKPSQRRGYIFDTTLPLYPFGYGLSYNKYEYSPVTLSSASMKKNQQIVASVKVKNQGKYVSDEIVQMYIHDKVSSSTRPVRELKGFQRVTLNPGEEKEVSFVITEDLLKFYNNDMQYVSEPGDFTVFIGGSSETQNSAEFKLID
ncbi:MAG: glycoside hydrolase family 3 C-terminal domain-containing protein [Cytophagaceae bacterium]|nr:glycoside hydrolase family 3 C-terminal domain-containing protein [Cytophagaceae bacterium]MDW8456347.1 glycoside hydrolase family 3 N-terminal domain-containing protein [Cytophagaceae bacterium]